MYMGWKIADLAQDPTPSHHRESTDTLDRSLGVLVALALKGKCTIMMI